MRPWPNGLTFPCRRQWKCDMIWPSKRWPTTRTKTTLKSRNCRLSWLPSAKVRWKTWRLAAQSEQSGSATGSMNTLAAKQLSLEVLHQRQCKISSWRYSRTIPSFGPRRSRRAFCLDNGAKYRWSIPNSCVTLLRKLLRSSGKSVSRNTVANADLSRKTTLLMAPQRCVCAVTGYQRRRTSGCQHALSSKLRRKTRHLVGHSQTWKPAPLSKEEMKSSPKVTEKLDMVGESVWQWTCRTPCVMAQLGYEVGGIDLFKSATGL
mmetsp:Transcript_117340/g.233886  ORF Transcript_117340/g.233886 Transcript_117340/m.233886 type:complete len:262 (+) Transcript_117340:948-1733(+)